MLHDTQNIHLNEKRILYTPSQLALNSLFYLYEIGMLSCKPGFFHKCDSLNSFLFLIVIEGNGTLNYKGDEYDLKPGCIAWIDCNFRYSYISSNDKPLLISWINCNNANMRQLYSFFIQKQDSILIHSKEFKSFLDIYSDIELLVCEKKASFEYSISLKIHTMINMMTFFSRKTDGISNVVSSISEKGTLIREYLEQNFSHRITLDDLSREFCVSKYYMLRSFRNQYGMTIIHYLQYCRIQHAKKLLRFSDMQIEEIGRACGIDDVSYFNKIFRSYEGMTAGQYRKKWKS